MAVCIHEASHALVGRVVGLTAGLLRVGESPNRRGYSGVYQYEGGDAWRRLVCNVAGPVSDRLFGRDDPVGIQGDERQADETSFRVDPYFPGHIRVLAETAARAIIIQHQDAIEKLARCLYDSADGELSGAEIEQILAGFGPFTAPARPVPASTP